MRTKLAILLSATFILGLAGAGCRQPEALVPGDWIISAETGEP